jgi:hypothetical protein
MLEKEKKKHNPRADKTLQQEVSGADDMKQNENDGHILRQLPSAPSSYFYISDKDYPILSDGLARCIVASRSRCRRQLRGPRKSYDQPLSVQIVRLAYRIELLSKQIEQLTT